MRRIVFTGLGLAVALSLSTSAWGQSGLNIADPIEFTCVAFDDLNNCISYASISQTQHTIPYQAPPLSTLSQPSNVQVVQPVSSGTEIQVIRPIDPNVPIEVIRPSSQITPITPVAQPGIIIPAQLLDPQDYGMGYWATSRFNWEGLDYAGTTSSETLNGWSFGGELASGALYASGRLGHYTDRNGVNYAAGAGVEVFGIDGAGSVVAANALSHTNDYTLNIFDGTVGLRQAIAPDLSAHFGLTGKLKFGDFAETTAEAGQALGTGASTTLVETLEGYSVGPRVGLNFNTDFGSNLRLHATAGVGPVFSENIYVGTQRIGGATLTSELDRNEWGLIADALVMLEAHTGGNGSMVFGLFANYESVGAEIVRPHAAASPALFLEFSENFDAGLGLGMKFRF